MTERGKYVKEISIGILSSTIFLIFIQPILNLFWDFLKISTFSLYQFISSKIIRQAALGEVNFSDSLILFGVLGGLVIIFLSLFEKTNSLIKRCKTLGLRSADRDNIERKKIINLSEFKKGN